MAAQLITIQRMTADKGVVDVEQPEDVLTSEPTHPQQYVQFDGKPTPVEEVADIMMATTRGTIEERQDATFRLLGRRLGFVMPAPMEKPAGEKAQADLDACCRIAVKR